MGSQGLHRIFSSPPEPNKGLQAAGRERGKREARLHQLQRLMQPRVMHAPLAEPVALHGVGPRVEEPGSGLIPLFAYFGPSEEMRLKE